MRHVLLSAAIIALSAPAPAATFVHNGAYRSGQALTGRFSVKGDKAERRRPCGEPGARCGIAPPLRSVSVPKPANRSTMDGTAFRITADAAGTTFELDLGINARMTAYEFQHADAGVHLRAAGINAHMTAYEFGLNSIPVLDVVSRRRQTAKGIWSVGLSEPAAVAAARRRAAAAGRPVRPCVGGRLGTREGRSGGRMTLRLSPHGFHSHSKDLP